MEFLIGDKNICDQEYFQESSVLEVNENTYIQFAEKRLSIFKTDETTSLLIGSPLYNGMRFENILEKVTNDFINGTLQKKDLKGNYIFLIIKNGEINVLIDRTNQYALFYDKKTGLISNSFLTLLDKNKECHDLNLLGLYEKIALGFNIGEDTIFKNIIKLTRYNYQNIKNEKINIYYQENLIDLETIDFHNKGRKRSIDKQIEVLSNYFELIEKTFEGKQGDLGLSGGFDCRLLLALAQNTLSSKLHLHTHATVGAHESQQIYAEKLGTVYQQSITKIQTNLPLKLSEAGLKNMLFENLQFFDGRSARHLGAFSETYTQDYKEKSMRKAFYSINGLGGEIYRDSYFTGKKKMSWAEWCNRYLFLPLTSEILPKSILKELSLFLKEKIKLELSWGKTSYDILFTHAYYGLIKMPQCNGSLVSAYNKVSPFLLPFVEYDNVIEALKAIPYLGIGGGYQAKMISELSHDLAKQPNHYGPSFLNLGWKYYTWSFLKTIGSARRRDALVNKNLIVKANSDWHINYLQKLNNRELLQKSLKSLKEIAPELNLNLALVESTQKRALIYLAFFLKEYEKKINL